MNFNNDQAMFTNKCKTQVNNKRTINRGINKNMTLNSQTDL